MSAPSIAAIIPVYNRPTVVLEALDSIAAQTRAPDRVIVVDDGSTDDTADRVQSWMDRHGSLRCLLIRQPNRGAAGARNRAAAEAADCELLAYLDSDDLWPKDYIARIERTFSGRPDLVAATADLLCADAKKGDVLYTLEWARGRITALILSKGTTGTPNTVVRAEAYRAVGGQDETIGFGEDRHLFLRLSLRGTWAYMPGEPVVARIGHAQSRGERDHFGYDHADNQRIHAQMMERFMESDGGAAAIPAKVYRKAMARWWFNAGRQLLKLDRRREAHDCFRRCLRWRPLKPRFWWHAAVTLIGR